MADDGDGPTAARWRDRRAWLRNGGGLAASVSASFALWLAIDISQKILTVASRHKRPPPLHFIRANAIALPLRSATVDAVIATFPTNYIFDPTVTKEIARVLKPNGTLVVVLTAELRSVGFRRRLIRAVSAILDGPSANGQAWTPDFVGFEGRWDWAPTLFGRALVYVGRRL